MNREYPMLVYHSKPHWLKKKIAYGTTYRNTQSVLKNCNLHTVCEEARCPNRGECYSRGTATFLILGNRCTRSCRFCAVTHKPPVPPDTAEPLRVAEAVCRLKLQYVVVTSVTRDDLPDGGARYFAETVYEITRKSPQSRIEVLIPDFMGSEDALRAVIDAHPDVLGHNIETVPRLYAAARPGADYARSLEILKRSHEMDASIITKSGLMLGLGETPGEIRQVLTDLLKVNCTVLTLGQYLQPHEKLLPVERFIPPEEFIGWKKTAMEMGFQEVVSGPFVRSSYRAEEVFDSVQQKRKNTGSEQFSSMC